MKIKDLFVLFISISIISIFSCKEEKALEVRGVTDKSIKIGASFPITGAAASLGVYLAEAERNYVNYINDQGGIHGRKLDLVMEDDRYIIPPAIAALKKMLYKDKIFAMFGPGSASILNVLWKKIQDEKLPTISLVTPEVAFNPPMKYIFGVMDTYPGQAKVLVDYMIKDFGIKKPRVAIVYPDTKNGKNELESTLGRLKRYNLKPVTIEVLHPASVDASSQVINIKRSKANCIVHAGTITPTTVALVRDLRKLGAKIPVFASWGAMLGEALNRIGQSAKQVYSVHATSPWYSKGPGMEEMRKITLKYHPGTERPYRGTIYTHCWICNVILKEGLKIAGRDLDEDALIEALEDIEDYDTGGLCGPITYSSESHKGGSSWKIYKANPIAKKFIPLTDWRVPK